ncbi:nitroreductase family protein [Cupriavidus necator]|uniref:nitroreductase family protein n=1 Tax=Cupriavidus necator TaxID=106590 RepID=UPI000AC21BA9|nr:nitroreductase family protein [Cupriavidus necator]
MDELKRIPYQPIKDLLPRPASGTSERVIALPQPDRTNGLPLMGALWQRMSTREFDEQPLPLQQLSELLWAAAYVAERGRGTDPVPDHRASGSA